MVGRVGGLMRRVGGWEDERVDERSLGGGWMIGWVVDERVGG